MDPEALAEVANLRSDLRDEIALVRGALEEMDALASAVHEGKGALAAVKADLERERIEGDAAVDAELERLRAELARLDGETRADVVNVTRTLATTRARMDEAEAEAEEARRAVRAMEGEVARVLDASAGWLPRRRRWWRRSTLERGSWRTNARKGHRRRSHNAEMEELQRQLCALMRDREEALARFLAGRNRLGPRVARARMGRTSSSFGGRRAAGTGGGVRPRGRDETRNGRIAIDGGWVRPPAPHVARRTPSPFTRPSRSRRVEDDDVSRSSSSLAATRRGARPRRRDAFVRAPARVVADPGPAPAAPAPPGAFAVDVGVEPIRLVAIEFE